MTFSIINTTTIGSKALIMDPLNNASFTEGYFDNDYDIIEKSALRNNLSEDEAFKLIEKIRKELPMNQ